MVAADQTHPSIAASPKVFGAPGRRLAVRRQLHYALRAAIRVIRRRPRLAVMVLGHWLTPAK